MITANDLIVVTLDKSKLKIVLEQARLSSIGGPSQVRKGDRKVTLKEDQISGQACQMAASIHLFGSIDRFIEQREQANANPYEGDGGIDFLNTRIDVKGGNKRKSKPILDYNLIVPLHEFHDGFCYVSALTKKFDKDTVANQNEMKVCLIGWAPAEDLIDREFYDAQKRMLTNRFLNPMKTIPDWAFET